MTCRVCLYKKNGARCAGGCRHSGLASGTGLASASSPLPGSVVAALTTYILELEAPAYTAFQPLLTKFPSLNATQLTQILNYIYTKPILAQHAARLSQTPATLADFFLKCAALDRHPTHLKHLKTLQNRWRQGGFYLPFPPRPPPPSPINDEDPFTLESLADLPAHTLWTYTDPHGHCYGFHAPSLYHYIDNHGPYNPYTRERIPNEAIDHLYDTVARLSSKDLPDFTVVWTTPRDAFVDVLYEYESFGYYTQVSWFMNLTPHRIIAIYSVWNDHPHLGRDTALGFPLDPLYSAIIDDPETGAAYQFARDLRAFIRSSTDLKFYGVAQLFLILGRFSPEIRRHLPPWISLVGNAVQS